MNIIITDAHGFYNHALTNIIESLGHKVLYMDEDPNKVNISDFTNYPSLYNLGKEYAIFAVSDKASIEFNTNSNSYSSKLIYTKINNIHEYTNKYNQYIPDNSLIPFRRELKQDKKVVIKAKHSKGTRESNGSLIVLDDSTNEYIIQEYIHHENSLTILGRFENGILKDLVYMNCAVDTPRNIVYPNIFINKYNDDKYKPKILQCIDYLEKLGSYYKVDGIIDAEFALSINDDNFYFIESNPRQNDTSYHHARSMVIDFINYCLSRSNV